MNNDLAWLLVRYALLVAFTWLGNHGVIPPENVTGVVDQIVNATPVVGAALTAVWGVWIKWNTKTVPEATGARPDVPTVSPVTGAVVVDVAGNPSAGGG